MENRLWKQIGLDKRKWEPFAEQVCSLSDEEIIPFIPDMLEWLQDMNWPGAVLYAKRLRTLPKEVVYPVVERTISQAKKENDEIWMENLQDWLDGIEY